MNEEELIDLTQILLAIIKKEKGNVIIIPIEELKQETEKIKSVSMKINKKQMEINIEEKN